ncbi:UDP-N-acetylmuramoyl-L-alanine--D-glutamate ligase [Candidatus Gromoviella agglomerans]|uniref:UDP-N-acetylmuramoyl-L-alanine--D-glutamate ligase n=1 Tax=Candidatus Gromoviella agglomerans TaxID=2806609 RepID=UPI001E36F163|nr:UDP-N-acetylmuramoyl-L-alanine--D-glutamate ligase [Candidatus Gromoviella agglomerans]UFX98131.1 UDP-N-acetylmuramoylalanine--D-glutamate ligase [Candidatus Gromoviella agglomerans]
MIDLRNVNSILVIGLGITGKSVIKFFRTHFSKIKIYIHDDDINKCKTPIEGEIHSNYFNCKIIPDLVFVSPGLNFDHLLIKKLQKYSCKLINDVEFFLQQVDKNALIIAITGSNGKSTTASLLQNILGQNYGLCGNIGQSPLALINAKLKGYIIEISSAQLMLIQSIHRINIGILTNITPNHLDFHHNMEEYCKVKAKILYANKAFTCANDANITNLLAQMNNTSNITLFSANEILSNGYSMIDSTLYINGNAIVNECYAKNVPSEALLISAAIAHSINFSSKHIIDGIKSFKGLPHRTELIYISSNILCINDSKSTTIAATIFAIKYCKNEYHDRTIILIIGGGDKKKQNFSSLKIHLQGISYVYVTGECKERMYQSITSQDQITDVFTDVLQTNNLNSAYTLQTNGNFAYELQIETSLEEILRKVSSKISKNLKYCILFSPGCESYDQYQNFEHRGQTFRNLCTNILKQNK